MKKLTGITAIVIACVIFLTAFSGCMASPQKQILGTWKDSTGAVGYEFLDNGTVKFTLLTLPVTGTYTMDTKAGTITMTGTILVKSVSKTYKYLIKDSSLTLTDVSSGDAATYIKEVTATTTAK